MSTDLVSCSDDALVELISEDELPNYKQVHDQMEDYLFKNQSEIQKYGQDEYSRRFRRSTVTAFTEMASVRPDCLQQFVTQQVAEMVQRDSLISTQARTKFASNLRKVLLCDASFDGFQRFDIEDNYDGTRTLERFVFRQKLEANGNIVILFSYFGRQDCLARSWKYLVANHDEQKVREWLDYKLFKNIMTKMRSLVPRQESGFLRSVRRRIDNAESEARAVVRRE